MRAYSDDSDDRILAELQPRYIIMFEPNLEFVRRVEVYKRSTPGLGVRVYLMIYNTSFEEAKYLAGVRREKDAFERIIKERGVRRVALVRRIFTYECPAVHAEPDTRKPRCWNLQ